MAFDPEPPETPMTKLTLDVDQTVADKAQRMAQQSNTSVAALFSAFVRSLPDRPDDTEELGPLTRKLTGILEQAPDSIYEDDLARAVAEKHGTGE
jgi:hypothetical protein